MPSDAFGCVERIHIEAQSLYEPTNTRPQPTHKHFYLSLGRPTQEISAESGRREGCKTGARGRSGGFIVVASKGIPRDRRRHGLHDAPSTLARGTEGERDTAGEWDTERPRDFQGWSGMMPSH